MRILCLDFGEKRVGVAVSDPMGMIAQGVATIIRKGLKNDVDKIASFCTAYGVELMVVGLPLDSEGEEGKSAEKVRIFMDKILKGLKGRGIDVAVEFWDESHSTILANERMIGVGLGRTKRKRIIDKMAAVAILQDYLDNVASPKVD